MSTARRLAVQLFVACALHALPALLSAQARRVDPVRNDPASDTKYPPSMAELAIPSHGARMNGLIYVAPGAGPHPILILLHGFPGNERNLDIAQAARRAGYDVLYFDYRGSWGSGGTFSFANARDDVASAIAWARTPANAAKYRMDPRRIALVGHSMGGWLALQAAALDQKVGCIGALAAWNLGYGAQMMKEDPSVRKSTLDYANDVTSSGGPLRTTGEALVRELEDNSKNYDYLTLAPRLTTRSVLLIAATKDSPDEDPAMHARLERALKTAGARHVTNITYVDDHPFSAHRVALTETIINWLNNDCQRAWPQ